VFTRVVLSGAREPGDPIAPRILWAYHDAADLKSWSITRSDKPTRNGWAWTLSATIEKAETFYLTQTPLRFVAPRRKAGFWNWPITEALPYCHACRGWHAPGPAHTGANKIRANLGPPEF